jgi:hypothetical protein
MSGLSRAIAGALFVGALISSMCGVAVAKPKPPPVTCQHHNKLGQCIVTVRGPGGGGSGGGTGGSGGGQICTDAGQPVPCERAGLGAWDQGLNCYVQVMRPQPPKTNPVWNGHTGGAVYLCTVWPPRTTGTTEIWFATPPGAVDPRVLALQAERQLTLPQPSGHRSPSETQSYQGSPFTYVNLWTWFWTDPGTWRTRSATARAGGVSATVTVTPTRLSFDPGDGSASVSCQGPGIAWSSSDGNAAPSDGECGYRYRTVTQTPVTSRQSIRWSVTWTASDGARGALPDLTTSRAGQLMVLQIESVVSR